MQISDTITILPKATSRRAVRFECSVGIMRALRKRFENILFSSLSLFGCYEFFIYLSRAVKVSLTEGSGLEHALKSQIIDF